MAQVTQARKLTCNEQPQELSSPGGVTHHHPHGRHQRFRRTSLVLYWGDVGKRLPRHRGACEAPLCEATAPLRACAGEACGEMAEV